MKKQASSEHDELKEQVLQTLKKQENLLDEPPDKVPSKPASQTKFKRRAPDIDNNDNDDDDESPKKGNQGRHQKKSKEKCSPPENGGIPVNDIIPVLAEGTFEILSAKPNRGLVLFGDKLHRIVPRGDALGMEAHSLASLMGHIARAVPFCRYSKGNEKWEPANPPKLLIEDLLALGEYPSGIPRVNTIKTIPYMTKEGKLLSASGLYPEYRLYLNLDPSLEDMDIPDKITKKDIKNALEILEDILGDFPFHEEDKEDASNAANCIAMLFTIVFRECVEGLTPLFLIDANRRSSGKSLLVNVMNTIAYGSEAAFSPADSGGDELRKKLFSLLSSGTNLMVLDNVDKKIFSTVLAGFLTSTIWVDRKLGVSESFASYNQMMITATGNNLRVGEEIARRSVLIRLSSPLERPEERNDFRHSDLIRYILQERRNILRAMYIVLFAWHRKGRPIPKDTSTMNSFQPWVNFGSAMLDTLGGFGGLIANWNEVRERDSDAEEYHLLLRRAWLEFGRESFTANKLAGVLQPEDIPLHLEASKGNLSKRLSHLLIKLKDQPYGNVPLTLRVGHKVNDITLYRLDAAKDYEELRLEHEQMQQKKQEEHEQQQQDAAK